MSKEQQVTQLTDYMAKFIAHIAKKLPDDVIEKLTELREKEDSPLSKVIYDTMFKNQELAVTEQTKLSGYRCITVLGKMWNKIPTYRRTGRTSERRCCESNI